MIKTAFKWIVSIAAVVLIFLSYYFVSPYINAPKISEDFAYGNGRIEATEVNIATKIPGRLLEIYAKEGDIVEKGQMLAKLDSDELEAKLRVANAQIRQAEQNKNYALAIVEQKKSELALKHENYLRGVQLYDSKSISLLQYQQYETAYKSAQADLESAKAHADASNAAIEAAMAQADAVRVNIKDSTLYAPVKGRVLYRLAEPGEVVGSGSRVMVVLDLLDTYMTIFLPTSQAGLVQYGSEARIVLDAIPAIAIPAKVTFVSPQAQFTPKQIETKSEREKLMFRIKATVDINLLKEHLNKIKTGLPGMTYIRLNEAASWPKELSNLPKAHTENVN
jgi:HlyD family secretion protein